MTTQTTTIDIEDESVKLQVASILRDRAAEHERTAQALRDQAEALNPLFTEEAKPAGGARAPKGRVPRKQKDKPAGSNGATEPGIEPTLGQVAAALKSAGSVRIGTLASEYGYDRAKTLVLLKELAADGRANLLGKTWAWNAEQTSGPTVDHRSTGAEQAESDVEEELDASSSLGMAD
jgi:hypothetical protein